MNTVLVIWPDGPRYINESTLIGWATDDLANEKYDGDLPPDTPTPSLEEAVEIVNHYGGANVTLTPRCESCGVQYDLRSAGWHGVCDTCGKQGEQEYDLYLSDAATTYYSGSGPYDPRSDDFRGYTASDLGIRVR